MSLISDIFYKAPNIDDTNSKISNEIYSYVDKILNNSESNSFVISSITKRDKSHYDIDIICEEINDPSSIYIDFWINKIDYNISFSINGIDYYDFAISVNPENSVSASGFTMPQWNTSQINSISGLFMCS